MEASPLKRFLLTVVLWLPLAFFLWFYLASLVVFPVIRLAKWCLLGGFSTLFAAVGQNGFQMEVVTRVLVEQMTPSGASATGELILTVNPMVYGYALPLFAGLVMATPLAARARVVQIAIGIALITVTQTVGAVFEALKLLAFESGPAGIAALSANGVSREAIALGYQFGYLILPALTPAALWIVLNRRFIESVAPRRHAEPAT